MNPSVIKLLAIPGILILLCVLFLGYEIFTGNEIAASSSASSTQPVATDVKKSTVNAPTEAVAEDIVTRHENRIKPEEIASNVMATVHQEQQTETPIFYHFIPDRVNQLSEVQTMALSGVEKEYVDYYNEWINTYPHDVIKWNDKMRELETGLFNRLGPEAADNLLR